MIFGTSWDTVYRAVDWVVRWGLVHREIADIEAIGVDEIAYRRGHKYLTLVYQIDVGCRRLLYVARDRTEESLRGFFGTIAETAVKRLKFVCADMWRQYMTVIAEKAEDAVHILDRYHVMKKFGDKLNKVRAQEARQMKQDGYEPILKNSRWCLLKRRENLTDNQTVKLKELLQYNLRSVKAYLMREDFQRFWEYESATWAGVIEVVVRFPVGSGEESGRIWWMFDRAPDGSPEYLSKLIPDDNFVKMYHDHRRGVWVAEIELDQQAKRIDFFCNHGKTIRHKAKEYRTYLSRPYTRVKPRK